MPPKDTSGVEKLANWLSRPREKVKLVRLVHELALSGPQTVSEWEAKAVKDDPLEAAQEIATAAQDHADSVGESCRFGVQWIAVTGGVRAQTLYRADPSDVETPGARDAALASGNALVAEMLSHIREQQKTINGGIGALLKGFETVIRVQSEQVQRQGEVLRELHGLALKSGRPQPLSPEQQREHELRMQALQKLLDFGPIVGQMALQKAAEKLGFSLPADTGEPHHDA